MTLLTNQSSSGSLSLNSEDNPAHLRLVCGQPERNRDGGVPVHAEAGDGDEPVSAHGRSGCRVTGASHGGCWSGAEDSEGVR